MTEAYHGFEWGSPMTGEPDSSNEVASYKNYKDQSPPPTHTRIRSSTIHLGRSPFLSFEVYISECTQQPQISLFERTTSILHTFKTQPCLSTVKSFRMQQSALMPTSKAPPMFLDRISSSTISIRLTVPVTKMFCFFCNYCSVACC